MYETVIGLEVHVQLNTESKAFCSCSTTFGAPPNTHVCPVCLGLPGVLPVFNEKVLEYGIKSALALDCEIQHIMKFDRKNYYYPDLPKNYQISQFDMPLAFSGKILINIDGAEDKCIGVTRIHIEEDAGKLVHSSERSSSYVDLNRTGTPLLEIVSEPDMRSPEEAYAYLTELKQIIKYLGISDCNMEEGSLRCDANISLRISGEEKLGSKVEIKNLNSFKAVRDALKYEEERQEDILEEGGSIKQETRLWDEDTGATSSMRSKEESHDYRYFPEPDLVPFEVPVYLIEKIRNIMPELPAVKNERFLAEYKLSGNDVRTIISDIRIADFYETLVKETEDPQASCNWLKGEVMMHMKEQKKDIDLIGIEPKELSKIIKMSKEGKISHLAAKDVLKKYIDTGKDPFSIVKDDGLEQVSEAGELKDIIEKVINENQKSAADFKGGKENALSFLIGQVMRHSKGKANPKIAGDMLREMLK